jgi:hypothetical protein
MRTKKGEKGIINWQSLLKFYTIQCFTILVCLLLISNTSPNKLTYNRVVLGQFRKGMLSGNEMIQIDSGCSKLSVLFIDICCFRKTSPAILKMITE